MEIKQIYENTMLFASAPPSASLCFKFRNTLGNKMKLYMHITPLYPTLMSYFSTTDDYNIVFARTCKMRATRAPDNLVPRSDYAI